MRLARSAKGEESRRLTSLAETLDETLQTRLNVATREVLLTIKNEDHPAFDGGGSLRELQTSQVPGSSARRDGLVLVGDLRRREDPSGDLHRRRLDLKTPLVERRAGVGRTDLLDSLAEEGNPLAGSADRETWR